MAHKYPQHLVSHLQDRWEADDSYIPGPQQLYRDLPRDPLPNEQTLNHILSTAYQASLMREEERPVRCRLIFRDPERFDPGDGPPTGLHVLTFDRSRRFDENELRRLSPAADFYHSLIGVHMNAEGKLRIWGVIHSGPRWVQHVHGGRDSAAPLPGSLVVCITGAGRLAVCRGSITLSVLNRGQLFAPSLDVFDAEWLPEAFSGARQRIMDFHLQARAKATKPWANIDPNFIKLVGQDAMRRVISTVRTHAHGGTLLLMSEEELDDACPSFLDIKYRFEPSERRTRFGTLVVQLINTLCEVWAGGADSDDKGHEDFTVGWEEYAYSQNPRVAFLDEALKEWASLVAGVAGVDGAVVLSKRFELIGFGGVISGDLPEVRTVKRALDAQGYNLAGENTDGVGTRHRSAYRLCRASPESVAIVISQDGNIRFIKCLNDQVTYWDQVASSVLDF